MVLGKASFSAPPCPLLYTAVEDGFHYFRQADHDKQDIWSAHSKDVKQEMFFTNLIRTQYLRSTTTTEGSEKIRVDLPLHVTRPNFPLHDQMYAVG